MIKEITDSNYTGFAYVKDGILKDYIPAATREWYWVYIRNGRTVNNYIAGYSPIIRTAGSKVDVYRHDPDSMSGEQAVYYRFANLDRELFRYDGSNFVLRWRLFVRNILNKYWYYAKCV